MESSLVIELKIACVDTRYFVGLTLTGNSQFNLGKSRDEFKSKMKQGTWWTPITLWKEDTAHSTWMEELHGIKRKKVSAIKQWVERKIQWNVKDQRAKRWHNKSMRKKGCNLREKKLMNSSSYEASQTRKTSSKREGLSRVIYSSSHGVITLQ